MFNFFIKDQKRVVEISPSIVIFTIAAILGIYFIFFVHQILLLLFLAYILMVALNPGVTKLQKKFKIPRPLSIFLVYVLFISVVILVAGMIIPPLINQLYQLLKTIELPYFDNLINNFEFSVQELTEVVNQFGSSFAAVASFVTSTFSTLFMSFTLLVMSYYLLMERPSLHEKMYWFTNKRSNIKAAENFVDSLDHQLGGWVRGQIVLMSVIGIVTYIGLFILKVPFALPLAILAGFLEILPSLGPTVAAMPAILLATIAGGPVLGVITLVFYIVLQQVENSFLVPQIMSRNAHVSPLPSILSVLIGFKMFGVMGALLAIPIYIVIRTIYSTWFKKH